MKITILNISDSVIGVDGRRELLPSNSTTIEVNEDEYRMWSEHSHVKVLNTSVEPTSRTIQDDVQTADNQGCLLKDNEVVTTPITRRTRSTRKTKP